jgi:hypothetical protein
MRARGIALIMTPAIFHRVAERGRITRHVIDVASHLIAWAMAPLGRAEPRLNACLSQRASVTQVGAWSLGFSRPR